MDHTIIKDAATKIVANIKAMEDDITVLRNKQDIISTSDTTMTGSYPGRVSIEEIGGKCEQETYTGKNLVNFRNGRSMTNSGVAYEVQSDGSYKRTGTAETTQGNIWLLGGWAIEPSESTTILHLEPNVTYIVKDCLLYSNSIMLGSGIVNPEIFPNGADITGVRNGELEAGKTYSDVVYPMVCKAEDGYDWEPYTGGIPSPNPSYPQEIKKTVVSEIKTHGEQLLNYDVFKTIQTMNGTSVFENNGVTITAINRDAYTYYHANDLPEELKMPVSEGEEITLSWELDSDAVGNVYIFENGNPQTNVSASANNLKLTHTVGSGTYFVTVRFGVTNAGDTISYKNIMLNKGGEALPYEPYTESSIALSQSIELYGIGDVQDTIEDGKVVRRIKALHGTSGWAVNNVASGTNGYRYYVSTPDMSTLKNCKVICSHYTQSAVSSYWDAGDYICTSEPNCICIRSTSISTLDEFNTALANMITYYPLATPVIEELPLVDQMALNSLKTYDGITYVEIDSEIEPTFQGKYGITKNGGYILEGMLAGRNGEQLAKSNGDRITTLESTVVNNI